MKYNFLSVSIAAIAATIMGCSQLLEPYTIPAASITLDSDSVAVMVGEGFTLTATVLPENATDKTVTWSSSDPSVAGVVDGKVTALMVGDAVITATSGKLAASCAVSVYKKEGGSNEDLDIEDFNW